jgi:ribosomal protein S12 methylthiotransferase accessory factor
VTGDLESLEEKAFTDGTHRIVSPQATVARVLPMARRMGITRLAVLTGLDVLGIPVAAAVRPNSRSVAQHQGKGLSLAAAKASALMEAAEAFHAETFTGPLRLASWTEMAAIGPAVDTVALPGASSRTGERLLWAEGRDLAGGGPLWVPHELVTTDYTEPMLEKRFHATSNGLASGNNRLEAVLHALYEVVERDADALFLGTGDAAQDARAVDLDTIGGLCGDLLAAFRRAGVSVRVWDQTSDVGLPVFRCMAAPADASDPVQPELGYGCHADRDVALSRAITEVAQSRLTVISGARDDMGGALFAADAKARLRDAARRWLTTPATRDYRAAPTFVSRSLRADLDHALARLAAVGCAQVAHLDLSRPDIGLAVARVVVPGLEGPFTEPGEGYVAGPRARAVS